MNHFIRHEYQRQRAKGFPAALAFRAAKVKFEWWRLEGDFLKLEAIPDQLPYEEGDMFDPKANPDISPARLERERKELWKRINREGVWVYATYFRRHADGEWILADSIGGFIGDDFEDSGYDIDLLNAAIDALESESNLEAKYN